MRWFLFVSFVGIWALAMSCSNGNTNQEPGPSDASSTKEAVPEQPVETGPKETAPEKPQPPEGLGEACKPTPVSDQGTCKTKGLLCGAINDKDSICFENCNTSKCTVDGEECIKVSEVSSSVPLCMKIAKKGESCGIAKRIVCQRDAVDPPVFCLNGTCTERPKDGWKLGENCSFDPSKDQGDCGTGLICIEHARDEYRCAKSCTDTKDCPQGETCDTDLGSKKACIIISKIGEKCSPSERRFCRTTDPNNKVRCTFGVCKGEKDLKQLDEKCTKSIQPGEVRGDCDKNLLCLGVSRLESKCHKECAKDSDCPSGEICITHPNEGPGDPQKACVKPVQDGGTCDLTQRLLCQQQADKFFKCDRKEKSDGTLEDAGTCVEIKEGNACKTDSDCGAMRCITVGGTPPAKNCLFPCDPNNPCKNNAACQQWGQNGPTACMPVGSKKEDEACTRLAPKEGQDLDTNGFCVGGFSCVGLDQQNPMGVCMQVVAQCTATACKSPGHVCLAANGAGFCALDCSTNQQVCKSGTTCKALQQPKATICAP